jgi:hypothetical protein
MTARTLRHFVWVACMLASVAGMAQEHSATAARAWIDDFNRRFAAELPNVTSTGAPSGMGTDGDGVSQPVFDDVIHRTGHSPAFMVQQQVSSDAGTLSPAETRRFTDGFIRQSRDSGIGTDFYSAPEFKGGLIVQGRDVAMKIGGYVKADFIYDFKPIDSTDSFVTTSIPVGAPPRTNSRFHARQTRLSMDTRWVAEERPIRIYVEGDFFGTNNYFRLRHAYGESGSLLVGQTWTTFTDVAAAPATLDFEGSVSSVNRRQAQARWTTSIINDDISVAVAVEDTQFIIETPMGVMGEPRNPSPDFVGNIRFEHDWGRFHIGSLYRIVGFQPDGSKVFTASAWGLNFAGVIKPKRDLKVYYQVLFGEGIGSYRSLPDAAPTGTNSGKLLPLFGWMVGTTRNWNDKLSSNFTLAENRLAPTLLQDPDDVRRTTYLAANLIWAPADRIKIGVEYLHGLRENVNGRSGEADRIQASFIFDLP